MSGHAHDTREAISDGLLSVGLRGDICSVQLSAKDLREGRFEMRSQLIHSDPSARDGFLAEGGDTWGLLEAAPAHVV